MRLISCWSSTNDETARRLVRAGRESEPEGSGVRAGEGSEPEDGQSQRRVRV